MTLARLPRSPFRPRAGSAVTALFLGGLATSAAFGFLAAPFLAQPAAAQSAANPNDQPTPATLPGRDGAGAGAADRPTGQVAPPRALSATTSIMASDAKTSGARASGARTNPLDHLPARDRAAIGGTRRD
ncbi:hypothetical protein [Methylobacterium sp. J-068]|uniref:hypothetical protein n=1 Tax=Methylobacterium sp. J-068 TaxID=2836649 RepID=UPI001FB902EC|nr:hypothetical protein [Methylobacterium sp. J-068]MCJ2034684.1 hypothetical protein [Methylobacterium sp. J-068]